MLEKGSSEKWTKQLKELVGTERMDVQPLLEYFKPLQEFLDQQLKGQDIGWKFNGFYLSFVLNIIKFFFSQKLTTILRRISTVGRVSMV